MDDKIVFTDKAVIPETNDLKEKIGANYALWERLNDYVTGLYLAAVPQWSYSGQKSGWNFRLRDKKRVIIYLLPREDFFKVSMVFGENAVSAVLSSGVSQEIKEKLRQATKYAEGRGIQIDVKDDSIIRDIEILVGIKLLN